MIETPDKANAFYFAATGDGDEGHRPGSTPALVMADYLLGGGPLSSRLGNRIRQKEGVVLRRSCRISTPSARTNPRLFLMCATCNPNNIDKLDKAMHEEMNRMLKDGITETELQEAKKAYLATLKQRRADDSNLALLLQSELDAGRSIAYYGDLEKKINALTVEESQQRLPSPHRSEEAGHHPGRRLQEDRIDPIAEAG